MAKKRILILGAGLAGLSAALHLQKRGIDCRIFEKEAEIGGLCRSKTLAGFTFDCSGHSLHFKHKYSFDLVKDLLKGDMLKHKRSACVYSRNRYISYPFQANLCGLPSSVIKDCIGGLFAARQNGGYEKRNSNFLNWINHSFGKGIARHFMIPYNTKFWTLPLDKLTCEWVDSFIPQPSLKEVIRGAIEKNPKQFGYNVRFWYPKKGGIARLALAFARQIKNIYTNYELREINLETKEIKTAWGEKEKFDYLISTIPLPELPRLIKGGSNRLLPMFRKLKWNSIFNLNLGISREDASRRHWIYFPEKETSFFRVGFYHNFSHRLAPRNNSSLYVEVAYSEHKPIDRSNITGRIIKDLNKIGILKKGDKILAQDINDMQYGYPIYDRCYINARKKIIQYLQNRNIIPCGRYGSWRYLSMEGAILDGKRIAELAWK